MKQSKSLLQKPVFWVAILAIGIVGFVMTSPEEVKTSGMTAKRSRTSTKVAKGEDAFTKADEKAEFKPVNTEAKNAFVPVVARTNGISGAQQLENSVPADFAGGEANWIYTGNAEYDGVRQALIENRTTGDAVFLRRGQKWKNAYVVEISEYSVVLRGPSGTRTLGIAIEEPTFSTRSVASNSNSSSRSRERGGSGGSVSPMNPGQLPGTLPGTFSQGGGFDPNSVTVVPEIVPVPGNFELPDGDN